MSFADSVTQAIAVFLALVLLAALLRRRGVLAEKHASLFTRLITQVTLPALIFKVLSTAQFALSELLLPAVMISSQLLCLFCAWALSRWLRMNRLQQGALMLASAFPSSALMGYAIVKTVYAGNNQAISDAVLLSELGVGPLVLTLGVIIAIRYGDKKEDFSVMSSLASFFVSPIFVSLILGLTFSFITIPESNPIVASVYRVLDAAADANTFLVAFSLGLMLRLSDYGKVWKVALLALFIKLILQPLLAVAQAMLLNFPPLWRQVMVLEAAMPTAALTAVFAQRYGCDAELSSTLVFASFVSSLGTMLLMVFLLD